MKRPLYAVAASLVSASVYAQEQGPQSSLSNDAQAETPLRISVGAGVASIPLYPGSDRRKTRALPFVSLAYGRFFAGADPESGAGGAAGGIGFRARAPDGPNTPREAESRACASASARAT